MKNKWINVVILLLFFTLIFVKDSVYFFVGKYIFEFSDTMSFYFTDSITDKFESDKFYFSESKVLYRDIYSFSKSIIIYNGENFGYKENMAVLNENGLVGIITSVEENSSTVTLLTNKDINISVKVGEQFGILKYIDNTLVVTNLTGSGVLNEGDYIYTSGLANLYSDIYIGVVSTKKVNNYSYEIVLENDFINLDYLVVLKGVK